MVEMQSILKSTGKLYTDNKYVGHPVALAQLNASESVADHLLWQTYQVLCNSSDCPDDVELSRELSSTATEEDMSNVSVGDLAAASEMSTYNCGRIGI